ncbi:MAG: phosphotransferase family protein [Acidobacteria bacterium]|nr:phosphotransferase family protein [Acidobacteriota bacterium]
MEDVSAMLAAALGASRIEGLTQLSGGASRETWSFDADDRPLILQRDRAGGGLRIAATATEIAALRAAEGAGVPVAHMLASGDDWFVVDRVEGETIARRILRDEPYETARQRFAEQCGRAVAAIQTIDVSSVTGIDESPMEFWRDRYESYRDPHPVFELAFRWLGGNRPNAAEAVVVHGDFRMGNVIVGAEGVRALLDWEMVHAGDPLEDLAWLCVKSWRFGGSLPVGGVGRREDLIAAYEQAGGQPVDADALRWWELYGNLRWGVIAMQQVHTHLSGAERSVELAAIGRRVCEIEHDMLLLLP